MFNRLVSLAALMVATQLCQPTQVMALNVPTCQEPEMRQGENAEKLVQFFDQNMDFFNKIANHTVTMEEAMRGFLKDKPQGYQANEDEIKQYQYRMNFTFKHIMQHKIQPYKDMVEKKNYGYHGPLAQCKEMAETVESIVKEYMDMTQPESPNTQPVVGMQSAGMQPPPERILNAIREMSGNPDALCAKLNTLKKPGKDYLSQINGSVYRGEVEQLQGIDQEIGKEIDKSLPLQSCINFFSAVSTW